jgi:ATPase family AAA domain-containing protein 2
MQTLRVYRPRVIIYGPPGMGQAYIGAAALHHLEGYHMQSLELGTLMSDSTRVSYMCSFYFISDPRA